MEMDVTLAKKETGKRLKEVRIGLELTQEAFAERLEISVTLYKKMENGSYNISVKTLRKLREVAGISIDYIMFGEGQKYEDIWLLLQNAENKTKLKMLLRLLIYFGYDIEECYREQETEKKYSELIDKLIDGANKTYTSNE